MMHSFILHLRESGPFGSVALVSFSASAAFALALVVAALFARRSGATRAMRVLGALVAATFALGAFAISRVIAGAHVEMLQPMPVDPFSKLTWAWGRVIMESHWAWQSLALALVVVAALSGTALALVARRAGARRLFVITAAFACLVGALTGAGILRHFEAVSLSAGNCGRHVVTTDEKSQCIQAALQDGVQASSFVRVAIVALSTLGSGLVFVVSRRRAEEEPARDPEAALPLGASIFAFGLAAWFGARGMAHDARHTLPLPEDPVIFCGVGYPPTSSLPPAGPCDPVAKAPEVIVDAEGRAFGMERADTRTLGMYLRDKREAYQEVRGNDLEDPVVLVAAPAATPMAAMLPIVAAVENDFRGRVVILRGKPEQSVSTATLGELSLHPRCCSSRLQIDPNGAPLSNHATWGDVARAAGEGAIFRLDPQN